MRPGVPLGLIAWQLMLAGAVRALQRYNDNPHSLSNIELLVPLKVSDGVASEESDATSTGERYERAHFDKDMPFSNIPASAFVLDESVPVSHKKKRKHKHSRKQDLTYWPRSVYLESLASEESDERDERDERGERDERIERGESGAAVWRACRRLARSQAGPPHELLLLLCAELLDGPPARCPQPSRRDLVPIGGNPYMVQRYLRSRGRKRRNRIPHTDPE